MAAMILHNKDLSHLRVSYARKLVTGISGGVFDLFDAVLEFHSFDDLGELAWRTDHAFAR